MDQEIVFGGLDKEAVAMLFDCQQELDEIWSNLNF